MNKKYNGAPNQTVPFREADCVEITSLIDDSADFLSTIEREEAQQVRRWVKNRKGRGVD